MTMMKLAPLLAVALTLFASPASAQVNQQRYADLRQVTCEDWQTRRDMVKISRKMHFSGPVKVISSKTHRQTDRKLVCKVVLRYSHNNITKNTRGLFYLNVFSSGKWTVTFAPNY